MKRFQILYVLFFTSLFFHQMIAQELGSKRRVHEINIPEKIHKLVLDPVPAGTYSVGAGGYFPTIDSAFNKLSIDGIAGEVILELTDNLYTTTSQFGFFLNGPIPGAGLNSRVTIKPAANKNVTIEGNGEEVLFFLNTRYVTIDGISLTGSTTLTVHALYNGLYAYNDAVDFVDNSDHNIMQNITIICDDYTRCWATSFWILNGTQVAPDSNLIQNNFIKGGAEAIVITSYYYSTERATGNIVRGNIIGSATDSLVSRGIQVEFSQNTIIENNIVQNLRFMAPAEYYVIGINIFIGNSGIIRNNVVHNISSANNPGGSTGILLSGDGDNGQAGNNNQVYNNMVYDIQSTSTQTYSRVAGIQMWSQNNPKVYYNSVSLSGTGANPQGSAALSIYLLGNSTNVDARNNILVNTRDESQFCASAIYDYSAANLSSDFNDSNYEPNQYNCLVRIAGTKYYTLSEWQATGQDLNSITEMPNFISPFLHIDPVIPTNVESHATPISGITTDFDGDFRNVSTPDIGADEINGTVPVELTSFTGSSTNGNVTLNWSTATETNNMMFEIERRKENSDFILIGFVEGKGTTTERQEYSYVDRNITTGKYFYRLKQIDFDGTFEYSNEVEIEAAPVSFSLEQNYPNPFNPSTKISYSIPHKSLVTLKVYDQLGSEVAELVQEEKEAGKYEIDFNESELSSGVYFLRIAAGEFIQTKKMLFLK